MSKVKSYNQKSKEYQDLIELFLNKFESYFSDSDVKRDDIKKLFFKNLKTIKKHDEGVSFKIPIYGRVSGVYKRVSKKLEYTEYDENVVFHEMFHALSLDGLKRRESILRVLAIIYLGQKQLSVRELEEGMTEYLTGCIAGEYIKHYRFTFFQETTIVNRLAKIYGDEVILTYYLGLDNYLVQILNMDVKDGFKKVMQLCQKASTNEETPMPFEPTKYYKKNGEVVYDDFLFELFSKKKLLEVKTLDDFKHNLKELFNFYESDLCKICYEIDECEEELDSANVDSDSARFYQHLLEQKPTSFKKFNNILKEQWRKLNIDNEELYYDLVLNEIKSFNEFVTPIILDYLDYWDDSLAEYYKKQQNSDTTLEKVETDSIYNSKNNKVSENKKQLQELKESILEGYTAEETASFRK